MQIQIAMRLYYSLDYAASEYSFDTTRKSTWVAESLLRVPVSGVEIVAPAPLSFDEIADVHDPVYVQAVKTGTPRELAESSTFTWDQAYWGMVASSNGGAVAAVRAAIEDGVSGSLSSGLHHARRARGVGFCTFNGLVIAARQALTDGAESVLILDLDAHCGGGTHSLIDGDERIRQVDVSVSSFDYYTPSGKNTLDVVHDAKEYLPTIRRRLPTRGWKPDVCIYNAGMDPDARCQVGGLTGITAAMLHDRERIVFDWCRGRAIPIAFCLAGGYVGGAMSREDIVRLHRATIEEAVRRA
jgi:Deacetylases, including yeast histone deacetylase and acetoin utilization protein